MKETIKIIVIRKPINNECDHCYAYVEGRSPIIEDLQTVEMTRDDFYVLKRYYKNTEWLITELHENPELFVELNLEKALKKQKAEEKRIEARKSEAKKKAEARKKARDAKKRDKLIADAKAFLENEGILTN